jgi:ubiquinone/menaquinone biosynthesis C-methylase UbiE
VTQVASGNEEVLEAWNGVLFDRFVEYRRVVVGGIAPHGDQAIRLHPPSPGDRVLDIGSGFGDASRQLAALVGPEGSVLGVDGAPRFVETARAETAQAGAENVRFEIGDVQVAEFEDTVDYAFSCFGTMFFASPVQALRNVRQALRPGGLLCMVVWRRKLDNPWMNRA